MVVEIGQLQLRGIAMGEQQVQEGDAIPPAAEGQQPGAGRQRWPRKNQTRPCGPRGWHCGGVHQRGAAAKGVVDGLMGAAEAAGVAADLAMESLVSSSFARMASGAAG